MIARRCLPGAWAAVLTWAAVPAFAQSAAESPLTGTVALGVRSVDVDGTRTKYDQNVNLDGGVRVFDVSLTYAPTGDSVGAVDRVDLDASGLGGDPFESAHLAVRKYGAYELKLDHRRSQYFYEDTILPAAVASATGSTGGDSHHWDFERIRDTATLAIDISPATDFTLGLERQTRQGGSTTTLDIERDEFELDRPLDESLNALNLGLRHTWRKVTLIIDEGFGDFENSSELFLPGASAGLNATDPAELQFFMLDQSYDYESRSHMLRVLAAPTARLDLKAAWRREALDLDMRASEQSLGTSFAGVPVAKNASGPATVGRDLDLASLDFGLTLGSRTRLIGGIRSSTLDQDGRLLFGADQGAGYWNIETDGIELGVEVAILPNLVVTAGWSNETRDTTHARELNAAGLELDSSTERDGYFARFMFSTSGGLQVTASFEDNSIGDAFTLASPTSSQRYRVTAHKRWANGVTVTANHRRTDLENDTSAWAADTEQTDLRLSYQRGRVDLSAGYGRVELGRNVDRLVTAGSRQDLFLIDYAADAAFNDAAVRWTINERFDIGGEARSYENRGSFPLDREDLRAFVGMSVGRDYRLEISYRNLDYDEDPYDEYAADIFELAVRLDW
jgi:hypothetical protein